MKNRLLGSFRLAAFAITLLVLFAAPAPANTIIFEGTPVRKDAGNENTLSKYNIDSFEAEDLRLIISQKDQRFFWDSFGEKELLYTPRGQTHFFVSLDGSGFIEIVQDPTDKLFYYKESRKEEGGTTTYFGASSELKLPTTIYFE